MPLLAVPFIVVAALLVRLLTHMPSATTAATAAVAILIYLLAPIQVSCMFAGAAVAVGLGGAVLKVRTGENPLSHYPPSDLAYALAPALLMMIVALGMGYPVAALVVVGGALASVVSDTIATDFGRGFSTKAHLITTGRSVPLGTDGAITLVGTVSCQVAACSFGAFAALVLGGDWLASFLVLSIAGSAGCFIDSYIGATVQASGALTNGQVNSVMSVCSAVLAAALVLLR
jgi:Integral membrane protein DUF92